MKKLAMCAVLFSLSLFVAGCDNSPAAKKADAEKKMVNEEAKEMKSDIDAEAKSEKADVTEAAKEADADIDADKKAEEGK